MRRNGRVGRTCLLAHTHSLKFNFAHTKINFDKLNVEIERVLWKFKGIKCSDIFMFQSTTISVLIYIWRNACLDVQKQHLWSEIDHEVNWNRPYIFVFNNWMTVWIFEILRNNYLYPNWPDTHWHTILHFESLPH